MAARFWLDLTSEEFRIRDMARAIAVLPVAAIEQHGPHLPVGVDTLIAQGYLARVMELAPEELDVIVLPLQAIGASIEHTAFPGTLTLSAETALHSWLEVGESVHRAGCRKLVFANSHGGNSSIVELVARELRAKLGMLVVATSWHRLGYPSGLYGASELRHGIHGGEVETSLMMALRADAVRREKLARFPSRAEEMEREFAHLRADRPAGFGWMSQDLNRQGAMGDASAATAQKGEASVEFGARAFIELLREVDRFELEQP